MFSSIIRVFVSSTWLDLQPERRAVENTINRMSGAKFIGMEYFGSRHETTGRASLDEVDKSDLYIGVIGGRYGSGITEAEYRRALERGLPCFIYFKDEAATPAKWREQDAQLEALKQELRARHIIAEPFSSPDELAKCVTADLHRWFFDKYLSAQLSNAATGRLITGSADRRMRLDVGSEYGGVIHSGSSPRLRPRPTPLRPGLKPFRGLLDRVEETAAAAQAFESLLPVEFCGQSGIGKTALLRHLAYHTPDGKLPDGAIYLGQVGNQPSQDLLQFIFDSFYESDPTFKPREAEMLNLLRDKRALVLLDDVEIGRAEVERLMNAAPDSAFLLASEERQLFGEGRVITLPGLPAGEARQLLERELGRAIAPEEQAAARAICSILQGHPLRLAQTAALAMAQNLTLVKIAEQLQSVEAQSGDPGEAVTRHSLTSLPEGEKRALGAMAAIEGAPISAQALSEITSVSDIETALESLLSQRLIESHEAGYGLPASVRRMIGSEWDLTTWREWAMEYFTNRAEELQREPQRRELSAAILSLLDWASRSGRSRDAIRLGKAIEAALIIGGQWEAWSQTLERISQAAQVAGDGETEAWTLHQQGARALCLGDNNAARRLLTEALERRIEMGDHAAASVTRRNLDWLTPSVPFAAPEGSGPSSSSSGPTMRFRQVERGRIPTWLKFFGVALLAGLATLLFLNKVKAQFDPDRLSFANQPMDRPGAQQVATLTNTGLEPLMIAGGAIIGSAKDDFVIAEDSCRGKRLARNESCKIIVIFAPRLAGVREATLTLTGGSGAELPGLPLTGVAIASTPEPIPTPLPTPALTPTPMITATPTPIPTATPAPTPTPTPAPVPPIAPPQILDFTAKPQVINLGEKAQLCYAITNAASAVIEPDVAKFRLPEKDCVKVKPKLSTVYTITATGADGQTARRQTSVVVKKKEEEPEEKPGPGKRIPRRPDPKLDPKIDLRLRIPIEPGLRRRPTPTPTKRPPNSDNSPGRRDVIK